MPPPSHSFRNVLKLGSCHEKIEKAFRVWSQIVGSNEELLYIWQPSKLRWVKGDATVLFVPMNSCFTKASIWAKYGLSNVFIKLQGGVHEDSTSFQTLLFKLNLQFVPCLSNALHNHLQICMEWALAFQANQPMSWTQGDIVQIRIPCIPRISSSLVLAFFVSDCLVATNNWAERIIPSIVFVTCRIFAWKKQIKNRR